MPPVIGSKVSERRGTASCTYLPRARVWSASGRPTGAGEFRCLPLESAGVLNERWPLRTAGAVGDLVAVVLLVEMFTAHEGHRVAKEIHSSGGAASSRATNDQHRVLVS